MAVINTVHSDRFQHLDASGVPVTGIAQGSYSTRVATLTAANGTIQSTVPISIIEQSGGWYGTFWTPNAIGNWVEEFVYSVTTPARRWSGSVDVVDVDVAPALQILLTKLGSLSIVQLPLSNANGGILWSRRAI